MTSVLWSTMWGLVLLLFGLEATAGSAEPPATVGLAAHLVLVVAYLGCGVLLGRRLGFPGMRFGVGVSAVHLAHAGVLAGLLAVEGPMAWAEAYGSVPVVVLAAAFGWGCGAVWIWAHGEVTIRERARPEAAPPQPAPPQETAVWEPVEPSVGVPTQPAPLQEAAVWEPAELSAEAPTQPASLQEAAVWEPTELSADAGEAEADRRAEAQHLDLPDFSRQPATTVDDIVASISAAPWLHEVVLGTHDGLPVAQHNSRRAEWVAAHAPEVLRRLSGFSGDGRSESGSAEWELGDRRVLVRATEHLVLVIGAERDTETSVCAELVRRCLAEAERLWTVRYAVTGPGAAGAPASTSAARTA